MIENQISKPKKSENINNKNNTKKYVPFIEKYRPKKIEDLILPSLMQYKIMSMIENKTLPNLIITGSSGTGKTSTILCLAKRMLGSNKELILELNASNNRTLDFINTKVAYFCKKKLSYDNTCKKIIIFDEADNITKKAQNLLANLMEEYSYNTCFAFTCNESNKIIEAIQSRCTSLRYVSVSAENIKKRLETICKKENIIYSEDGLNIFYSNFIISMIC